MKLNRGEKPASRCNDPTIAIGRGGMVRHGMVEVSEGAPVALSGWVLTDRHDLGPCAACSLHWATMSVSNIIGGTGIRTLVSTRLVLFLQYLMGQKQYLMGLWGNSREQVFPNSQSFARPAKRSRTHKANFEASKFRCRISNPPPTPPAVWLPRPDWNVNTCRSVASGTHFPRFGAVQAPKHAPMATERTRQTSDDGLSKSGYHGRRWRHRLCLLHIKTSTLT